MKCSSRMRQTLFARVDTGGERRGRAGKGSCEYCRTSHFSSLVVGPVDALFRLESGYRFTFSSFPRSSRLLASDDCLFADLEVSFRFRVCGTCSKAYDSIILW